MIQQRINIHALAVVAVAAALAAFVVSVEGQFMAHRLIERIQEQPGQKLLKHIMELELPTMHRQLPAETRGINRRDMSLENNNNNNNNNNKERIEADSNSIIVDNKVIDSGDSVCNPTSSKFNYNGYDCICSRLANGKVFCKKQQLPISPDQMGRNDPQLYMMLNNFEKLVAQLKMTRPSQERKHH